MNQLRHDASREKGIRGDGIPMDGQRSGRRVGGWPTHPMGSWWAGGPHNRWVPHSIAFFAIEWGRDAADLSRTQSKTSLFL